MEISNEKILVVDAEFNICQILEERLSILGYQVVLATDGEQALVTFRKEQPDLIIIDIMLPRLDGYNVCNRLRKESKVPIIILTALGGISNRVMGFELGADDYVVKPFSPKELEARIRSVLRRTKSLNEFRIIKNSNIIYIGGLKIDVNMHQVFKNGKRVKLTGIEFNLLELLVSKAGEKLSRPYILDYIWGYMPERDTDTRVVDVHVSRLRSKLEEDPGKPDLILTVRGTGYMFQKFQTKNNP